MCGSTAIRMTSFIQDIRLAIMGRCWSPTASLLTGPGGITRPISTLIGPAGHGPTGWEPDSDGRFWLVGALDSDRDLPRHSIHRGGARSGLDGARRWWDSVASLLSDSGASRSGAGDCRSHGSVLASRSGGP